ncbi:uncharacterized protein LOC101860689 [Aplysia californica]|uniref:Uncharacterized protein LOC101860689 n=1 Tax=Aplysia californica TaxID=6500 RepID=A0ABM0K3S2_APLCA|nr:uncharacterized protein LOC101860689 [Aplysia californica]
MASHPDAKEAVPAGEDSAVFNEEPLLRRDSQKVRQNRQRTKERTPTRVVSDVFAFLNQNPSAYLEDLNNEDEREESGSVSAGDPMYANVKRGLIDAVDHAEEDGGRVLCPEFSSGGPNNFMGESHEKFVNGFQSKDSGFASLERQICDEGPGALYESYIKNEEMMMDDAENVYLEPAVGAADVYDNARPLSASDNDTNIYDDVDVSFSAAGSGSHKEHSTSTANLSDCQAKSGAAVDVSRDVCDSVKLSKSSTGRESNVYEPVKSNENCELESSMSKKETCVATEDKTSVQNNDIPGLSESTVAQSVEGKGSPESSVSKLGESCSYHGGTGDKKCEENSVHFVPTITAQFTPVACKESVPRAENGGADAGSSQVFTINLDQGGGAGASSAAVKQDSLDRQSYVNMYTSCDMVQSCGMFSSRDGQDPRKSSTEDDDEEEEEEEDVPSSVHTVVPEGQNVSVISVTSDEVYDTVTVDNVDSEGKRSITSPSDTVSAAAESCLEVSSGTANNNKKEVVLASLSTDSQAEDCLSVNSQFIESTSPVLDGSGSDKVRRRRKLEKNPSAEIGSDDSSDEDVGIYAESFRRSNWVRVSQHNKQELAMPVSAVSRGSQSSSPASASAFSGLGSAGESVTDSDGVLEDQGGMSPNLKNEDVFTELASPARPLHRRSDSVTTTASESEFKRQYVSRRKCLIQRADSQQEYHRLSARVYDQDKLVVVQRTGDSDDLGLHLLDSHPAYITSVDPGSAAEKAGIVEGQILVSVNGDLVLTSDHSDIVKLIQNSPGSVRLGVANSDFQPVRDLQASVMTGAMYKLGHSSLVRMWKKRYFILRQDNCLYYYKNDQEHDPLGAIPLGGYTISRHTDTSKHFCFKAEKYGARTYYFMTDNRDQLTEWVGALTEAAARSKKRKESFLSVSSHNVSLPALDVRRPECSGSLGKLSPSRRSWRRRYCVLKDACVYYYKDMNSLSALGVAHLHGYKVDAENHPRRKCSFSLQPPEPKMRVFFFSAENETDKKRWVEALIHSIQRWVKVEREVDC